MDRNMLWQGKKPSVGIEDTGGKILPLFDVGAVCGLCEDHTHLLGDGEKTVADYLQGNGIDLTHGVHLRIL